MKKRLWITIMVIIGVIIFSILIINKHNDTSQETAKCIGEKAVLYVQLGCHACEKQEEIFGDNYEYLNIIDCWYEMDKCGNITATPTWIIHGEKYVGVQSLEKLKDLTSCN